MTISFTSEDFQRKLDYRNLPRTRTTLQDVSFYRLGLMNETLVDFLMLDALLENPNPFIDRGDPSEQTPSKPTPQYVFDVFGDFRDTGSFHRKDKREMIKNYPDAVRKGYRDDAAEIANTEHLFLRKLGNKLGELFATTKMPDSVSAVVEQYKKRVEEYKGLVKQYRTYTAIPEDVMQRYNTELTAIINPLRDAFASVDSIAISIAKSPQSHEGPLFSLDNTRPINPKLPGSNPLAFLFMMTAAGRHVIDREFYPEVGFDFSTEVVGVESLISETMKLFIDKVERKINGTLLQKIPFDRDSYRKEIEHSKNNLMLLHRFHAVVDRGYPAAFADLEERLNWIGHTPEEAEITTPKEVAVMLYATACRLKKEKEKLQSDEECITLSRNTRLLPAQSIENLLLLADTIAKKKDLKEATIECQNSEAFLGAYRYATRLGQITETSGKENDPLGGLDLVLSQLNLSIKTPEAGMRK